MKGVIRGHGAKTKYFIDGKEVTKKQFDKAFPRKPIGSGFGLCGWKELHSEALAVHPKQIKEAQEDSLKKGVPTDFDGEGRPIFRTREHRAQYMRAYGFFDKHAGYGDAADGQTKRDIPPRPDPAQELSDFAVRMDKSVAEQITRELIGRRG